MFGMARAGRLFALLYRSPGGMELAAIITFAVFLTIVIFAVRRRQVAAWRSTVHVMSATVAGNALGIVLIWHSFRTATTSHSRRWSAIP